jgi:CRP/FNR family transcriptional regulator, cyclic AMP receptor protein
VITGLPPEASDGDTGLPGTDADKGFWWLLTASEQGDLSDAGQIRIYKPGSIMCNEGDLATHLFVLVTGSVKIISVTADGDRRVVALRGHGDVIGEISGETTGQRTATVQAIDEVHALIVGYERFLTFLESHPIAARLYLHVMIQRWSEAAAMISTRSVTTGTQRLAALLLQLAGRDGNGTDIAIPLSQEELAGLAGTSRTTVTRALRSWRRRGFIRTGQRQIRILDQQALHRAAGQQSLARPAGKPGGQRAETAVFRSAASSYLSAVRAAVCLAQRPVVTRPRRKMAPPQAASSSQAAWLAGTNRALRLPCRLAARIEPVTATPSDWPTCRLVDAMLDATPAWVTGMPDAAA